MFRKEFKPRLFVDLDGVLADFDAHYAASFGVLPCKTKDDVDWGQVKKVPDWYFNIPLMADAEFLWAFIGRFNPTVLTGVPSSLHLEAVDNKTRWVEKYFPGTPVICCPSKQKYLYCKPGDILIDDWDKYRQRWLDAGGRWVLHKDARSTIDALSILGFGAVGLEGAQA